MVLLSVPFLAQNLLKADSNECLPPSESCALGNHRSFRYCSVQAVTESPAEESGPLPSTPSANSKGEESTPGY